MLSFTPSLTATITPTRTSTRTLVPTNTRTPTATVTATPTPTITRTAPPTSTVTRTSTITSTPTITRTPTPTSPLSGARVSFAAPVDQNGCSFCCAFLCQLTPTPTPFIDDHGRQVFLRDSGEFLLVVEAAAGSSGRPPDTSDLMPSGNDRGDLQVIVSQNIGNGSAAICDMGPAPSPFGGVPGITDPSQFGPPTGGSSQVTAAIQDMECRFNLQPSGGQFACTRNSFGDFGYLGSNTQAQFCFQVPATAQFQSGDTVVGIQLKDVSGNLGPRKDIVIRVQPPP